MVLSQAVTFLRAPFTGIATVKQLARESRLAGISYVLAQRVLQARRKPTVVVFPDSMYTGSAGDLRACAIARELRRLGWRTITVPPWLGLMERQELLDRDTPDVILMQQTRHPLNNPELYPRIPCVLDVDDADIVWDSARVGKCAKQAAAVIVGNSFLAQRFREFNTDVSVVWTGTYIVRARRCVLQGARHPIVGWASSDPLSYPEEAQFVLRVLLALAVQQRFSFYLYGVRDEAQVRQYVGPLLDVGVVTRVFPPLRYRKFIDSLGQIAVGLQPICASSPFSQGKSFGKVLAYLAADVSIIASDAVDHGRFFQNGEDALLINGDVEKWVEACVMLLSDARARERMVQKARDAFLRRLTTQQASIGVDRVLRRIAHA